MKSARDTRYARTSDGAYIAYQTIGSGPIDLVYQFDWFGNVDAIWEDPDLRVIFEGLASFSRLILHDRRATGLSSRNVPVPDLETRIGDLRAALDTIGAERPVLGGEREGGAPNVLFAATHPHLSARCSGIRLQHGRHGHPIIRGVLPPTTSSSISARWSSGARTNMGEL